VSVSVDSTELLSQFLDAFEAAALEATARTGLLEVKDKDWSPRGQGQGKGQKMLRP